MQIVLSNFLLWSSRMAMATPIIWHVYSCDSFLSHAAGLWIAQVLFGMAANDFSLAPKRLVGYLVSLVG